MYASRECGAEDSSCTQTPGEPDPGEHENPEGISVRVRISTAARPVGRPRRSGGRARTSSRTDEAVPQIRSGSVTGSRQRAHLPR